MPLRRRVKAAVLDVLLRVSGPRPIRPPDLARADFSTHPGGKGLRFTRRLRNRLRDRWLRINP
jgi:hypothetical protein